jgi:hypothetical protein
MSGSTTNINGADGSYNLTPDSAGLSATLKAQFPHLKTALALTLSSADAANAKTRLKGQLVLAQFDSTGKLVQATSIQTANVLDSLYATAAENTFSPKQRSTWLKMAIPAYGATPTPMPPEPMWPITLSA